MTLSTVLVVDAFVIALSILMLARHGGLRHSHPGILYLAFHVLVFTVRAWAVQDGAATFLGTTAGEVARAVLFADLFLFTFTVGLVSLPREQESAPTSRETYSPGAQDSQLPGAPLVVGRWRTLSNGIIMGVAFFAMPYGLYIFLQRASVPGLEASQSVATTAYSTLALTWPGLLLLVMIYRNGFRFMLLVPIITYLGIMAIQGFARFRLVIPAIFLCQIWLDRRGQRWPGIGMAVLLIAMALVFFPLKDVGKQVQNGASFSEIRGSISDSIGQTFSGESDDQAILDQLAVTVALTDTHGAFFYGQPYIAVLTLPVPRVLWPEKPGLADHIAEISSDDRPLSTIGGVTTLVGDLYLNFWLFGLVFGGLILGRTSGSAFRSAYRHPFLSVQRIAYLLLASCLIQIARDGLTAVPIFFLMQNLPIVVILALHRAPKTDFRTPIRASGVRI